MIRLADLRAAASLDNLRRLPGQCRELDGHRKGQLALELVEGKCLILVPTPTISDCRRPDGGLDWSRVEAVQVIDFADDKGC
jgi:toxin HigB-1